MQHADETAQPLSAALRARTQDLHRHAERSGIVAHILSGRATPAAYALLLRNLQPVYRIIEAHVHTRPADTLARLLPPALWRLEAIESDLDRLHAGWRASALLPAAHAYAKHLATCTRDAEHLLLAHAYTRYLGDLSGGQVMRALLAQHMGLEDGALRFYAFAQVDNVAAQRDTFRAGLDSAPLTFTQRAAVIAEAAAAFAHNIAISEAVLAHGTHAIARER